MEIHPNTVESTGVAEADWLFLETKTGKAKLKTKANESLHPQVVATIYGWWQACQELKLTGYDQLGSA